MDKKLHKKLENRREKGTARSLSSFEGMIDFASNDYLGYAKEEADRTRAPENGATGSRLISGNSKFIEEVERKLADFFESEAGLCFNSGYDANIGIFSSIPQRGDVVLYDEFIHASARDGIRLSHGKSFGFKHNNLDDLRRLLELNKSQTTYIAIESVYSMHGDFCPLLDIIRLAEEYSAYVILDEAHAAGIYGVDGRGFAHALDLHSKCLIRLVTFGKAFGAHGAIVLCSKEMQEFLINFARSFIYTTALPSSAYQRMKESTQKGNALEKRHALQDNIDYFRSKMTAFQLISAANSPIQFIRFSDLSQLKSTELQTKKENIFTKAIFSPTVPEGDEGLRISLHSYNSKSEIDNLLRIIAR